MQKINHSVSTKVPRVTAVVVTYQSSHTLRETIAAVRRCNSAHVLDCVFVDNASTDTTLDLLKDQTNWAVVVPSGKNQGFGRGCNTGLALVKTPYTLFLNPDAMVEPDAVRDMVRFMDSNPKAGIVGPATLYGELEHQLTNQVTSALPTPWSVVKAALPQLSGVSPHIPIVPGSAPFQTGWVCGAVMMVRTELARQMQGFDPRFFLYSEEIDLCARAAARGSEIWALGTVTARHLGGSSSANTGTRKSGCVGKHYYQSRRYYMVKHHGWLAATVAEACEFALLCVGALADVVRGKGTGRIQPRLQARLLSQPEPF